MPNEIEQVYARFARIWKNGHPVRSAAELGAAVRAAELEPEQVSDEWLRSLSRAWVYHDAEDPFDDERVNRAYRRELRDLLV